VRMYSDIGGNSGDGWAGGGVDVGGGGATLRGYSGGRADCTVVLVVMVLLMVLLIVLMMVRLSSRSSGRNE